MSLLARTSKPKADIERQVGSSMPWMQWLSTLANYEGGSVEQAMRNAASAACIRVLASSSARTPFDALRVGNDTRTPVPSVLDNPSGIVAPDVWKFQVAFSLVTDGNAFGRIVGYDRTGWPNQIETLSPASVGTREVRNGHAQVSITGAPAEKIWPHGPIWHVPGVTVLPGTPFGISPLTLAAKTIGTSLSVEQFAHQYFTDGAHPTSAFMPDEDPGPEGAQTIKDRLMAATRGNREPLVLGGGKLQQLQSDIGGTQFIELARFEIEQACRHWGVPPSMVYAATSGQSVTYANVTQADLHYLKHSLDDYLVRLEYAFSSLLPRPQIVRANRNAILRSDVKARYDAYQVALANKFMSVNEVRRLEDLKPFADPKFDEPGIPAGVDPASVLEPQDATSTN